MVKFNSLFKVHVSNENGLYSMIINGDYVGFSHFSRHESICSSRYDSMDHGWMERERGDEG